MVDDMVANVVSYMQVDKVADMEVDKVADMEVDKVADMVADNGWVTWIDRPKGRQREVGARRAPRLHVLFIFDVMGWR